MDKRYSRRGFVAALSVGSAAAALLPMSRRLLARQLPNSPRSRVKSGTVVAVNGYTMRVLTTQDGQIDVTLSQGAHVWKKSTRSDFSGILAGDRVVVRGDRDTFGNFVASDVWANITNIFGAIIGVNGNEFVVLPDRQKSTGKTRTVIVDPYTVSPSRQPVSIEDIQVGRTVQTVGVVMPDGKVIATELTIYVNGIPSGMPKDAVIIHPLTGRPIKVQ